MRSTFLCVLILRCEDPHQVAGWYKDTLELPLEERNHEFSCMLGSTHFSIHGLQDGQSPTSNVEVGIYIPDLDEFVKKLGVKQIELTDPIRDYPWARAAQIEDPLGNLIYLMQLPDSSIKEIGRLLTKEFPGLSKQLPTHVEK